MKRYSHHTNRAGAFHALILTLGVIIFILVNKLVNIPEFLQFGLLGLGIIYGIFGGRLSKAILHYFKH